MLGLDGIVDRVESNLGYKFLPVDGEEYVYPDWDVDRNLLVFSVGQEVAMATCLA